MFSFREYFKLGNVSYKELGKRLYLSVNNESCAVYSAAMAYYLLFALFPFFLFLTTLIGYIPIPALMDTIMENLERLLPKEAFKLIQDNIKSLFMNKKGGLMSLSFLLALWTSSSAVTSVMDVMNRLYHVKEGRPFWKVRLIAIVLVFALSILFIVALMLLMFGPKIGVFVSQLAGLGTIFQMVWNVVIWPFVLFLLILAVALIYYFTPDVKQQWRWISPGSIIAVPTWLIASFAFSYYVNNFGSYNKTYGSIGAVIILLLWLYITVFIILVGAELNSEVEHASDVGKDPGEKVAGEDPNKKPAK